VFLLLSLLLGIFCAVASSYIPSKGFDYVKSEVLDLAPNIKSVVNKGLKGTETNIQTAVNDFITTLNTVVNSNLDPVKALLTNVVDGTSSGKAKLDNIQILISSYDNTKSLDLTELNDCEPDKIRNINDNLSDYVALPFDGAAVSSDLVNSLETINSNTTTQISDINKDLDTFMNDYEGDYKSYVNTGGTFLLVLPLLLMFVPICLIIIGFVMKQTKCAVIASVICAFFILVLGLLGIVFYLLGLPLNQTCSALKLPVSITNVGSSYANKGLSLVSDCRKDSSLDVASRLIDMIDPDSINITSWNALLDQFGIDSIVSNAKADAKTQLIRESDGINELRDILTRSYGHQDLVDDFLGIDSLTDETEKTQTRQNYSKKLIGYINKYYSNSDYCTTYNNNQSECEAANCKYNVDDFSCTNYWIFNKTSISNYPDDATWSDENWVNCPDCEDLYFNLTYYFEKNVEDATYDKFINDADNSVEKLNNYTRIVYNIQDLSDLVNDLIIDINALLDFYDALVTTVDCSTFDEAQCATNSVCTFNATDSSCTLVPSLIDKIFDDIVIQGQPIYDNFYKETQKVINFNSAFDVTDPLISQMCEAYFPAFSAAGLLAIMQIMATMIALILATCFIHRFKDYQGTETFGDFELSSNVGPKLTYSESEEESKNEEAEAETDPNKGPEPEKEEPKKESFGESEDGIVYGDSSEEL